MFFFSAKNPINISQFKLKFSVILLISLNELDPFTIHCLHKYNSRKFDRTTPLSNRRPIKIGDAYMIVAGIPPPKDQSAESQTKHVEQVSNIALAMRKVM